jgi:glycine cleavage system H protein
VSGEIIETNTTLSTAPETVNSDPHVAAWLVKIKLTNPAEVSALMDATAYQAFVSEKETSA